MSRHQFECLGDGRAVHRNRVAPANTTTHESRPNGCDCIAEVSPAQLRATTRLRMLHDGNPTPLLLQ
jgi:hypothetical protein